MTALQTILHYLRPHRRMFFAALALTAICTAVTMTPPIIVKVIIDQVITQQRDELLMPMIVLFAAVPVLTGLLRFFNNYVVTLIGHKLVLDTRRRLYGHLQQLPMRFFDRTNSGLVMERLMGDVKKVTKLINGQTVTIITDLAGCAVALVAMFWLNATLAIVPLLFVPVYLLTLRHFRVRLRDAQQRLRSKMDDLSGTVRERLQSTAIVKAFGQEQNESRRLAGEAFDAKAYGVQAHTYGVAFYTAATLQTWLARTGILLLGYYMVIQGQMTLGAVVAFTSYSVYLLGPAVRFAQLSNQLEQVMVCLRRVHELLRETPEAPDRPDALRVGRLRGEVRIERLGFHYEPHQPVLEDINLHVPAGTTVALVGHTGCGKTTLASLLYRMYDPTAGRITIDGMDITRIARKDLRRNFSLVPQDAVVFEGTIRENIAYGRRDAPMEKVVQAARVAELYDTIMAMPEKFRTRVGGAEAKLSVGQKQRLMIARAVLHDPAILILDEATSSLDGESEHMLQQALDRVMAERTCFVIAHRLSTIVNADMIVVMDAGRIVEVGNHRQLLGRADGHYRKLYLRQFAKVA